MVQQKKKKKLLAVISNYIWNKTQKCKFSFYKLCRHQDRGWNGVEFFYCCCFNTNRMLIKEKLENYMVGQLYRLAKRTNQYSEIPMINTLFIFWCISSWWWYTYIRTKRTLGTGNVTLSKLFRASCFSVSKGRSMGKCTGFLFVCFFFFFFTA